MFPFDIPFQESIDNKLDFIFETLEPKLLNKEYTICDNMLLSIYVDKYDIEILVGILTITHMWKDKLKNRSILYDNIKNHLNKLYSNEETNDILSGLE